MRFVPLIAVTVGMYGTLLMTIPYVGADIGETPKWEDSVEFGAVVLGFVAPIVAAAVGRSVVRAFAAKDPGR